MTIDFAPRLGAAVVFYQQVFVRQPDWRRAEGEANVRKYYHTVIARHANDQAVQSRSADTRLDYFDAPSRRGG